MAKKRRKAPSKPQEGRKGSDPSPDIPSESVDAEGAKAAEKTSGESSEEPTLIPQPHGGALLSGGVPGHEGGGGRPPNEFKKAMRELASNDEMLAHVARVLNDPDHPQWLGAWKWAVERGYGKTPSQVELSGPEGGPIPHAMVVKFVKAEEGE